MSQSPQESAIATVTHSGTTSAAGRSHVSDVLALLGRASVLVPTLIGFIGSIMVLIGSFAVGWLAAASPMNTWEWIVPLRSTDAGVITGTVLLTAGVWLMFWGWLRLGTVLRAARGTDNTGTRRYPPGSLGAVSTITIIWLVPLLFCLPIYSRDIFAYLNQGRLVLAGGDPYQQGISNLSNWFQLGTDTLWAQDTTPYGPIFLLIEAVIMTVSAGSVDLAILLFRLVAVAGVGLIMWFVPKLCARFDTDPARAQWIVAANPLFLISFVASAHNDALMIGLALASIWFAMDRRGIIATLLMVCSIGIKLITIVLLPFIGLFWAGRRAGWGKRFGYWAATLAIAVAALGLIGLATDTGFGWIGVIAGTGTGATAWAPVGMAANLLGGALSGLGLDSSWVLPTLKLVGRVASILIVLALMFIGGQEKIFTRMMWAFTALVLLTPVIQPWYFLWLIPLFAIRGIAGNWQLKIVVAIVAYFIGFGAADQLQIWQFVQVGDAMPTLSTLISLILAAWILLADPATNRITWRNWRVEPAEDREPKEALS